MKETWKEKCKSFFWPIAKKELIVVLPMTLMMFCFLFNYTIMRDLKDTLILNASGAEAIPFLKFWGTLPAAFIFVILYAKFSNRLKPKTLYIATILPFFIFFVSFGYILYPLREWIHPAASAATLKAFLMAHSPVSMHTTLASLASVYENWSYALFYIMSELWGSMGVSLLFWQFANDITSTEEAKRFYPRFTQLGNFAPMISGYAILYFSNKRLTLPAHIDSWGYTVKWLMFFVGLNCILLLITYHFVTKRREKLETQRVKKEKPKLSIKESAKILMKSKYLGLIALLVIGYGISTNLIEVVFKNQMKILFPTPGEMGAFYGKLSMSIGISTFLMVIFSGFILNRISWRAAAFATPLFMLVTGGLFFSSILYQEGFVKIFKQSPLVIGVLLGAMQYSLSKGIKYALFDPSKEMAYIPLDPESKVKGKAAIDVIGGRLGKSLGGLYLQFVVLFGAISQSIGLLYLTVMLVIGFWVYSVVKLNGLYQAKLKEKEPSASVPLSS